MKACEWLVAWVDLGKAEAHDILAHLVAISLTEDSLARVDEEEGGIAFRCSRHQIDIDSPSRACAPSEGSPKFVCVVAHARPHPAAAAAPTLHSAEVLRV